MIAAKDLSRHLESHQTVATKGGRPKLDLTDDERVERRRKQQEAYRRRQDIPAKEVRPPKARPKSWVQQFVDIWGKPPWEPLTPEEFAARKQLWNRRVEERQRAEKRQSLDAGSLQRAAERETQARLIRREPQGWAPFPSPVAANTFRRAQPTLPLRKRSQVQEVLRPVSLDWSRNRHGLTD